jgi:glycosyltransferase involved in cell wall biosynthesis
MRLKFGSVKDTPLLLKLFSPDLYLMKQVKKVTVLNTKVRSKLISLYKVKPENIEVIPPKGIDINEFNPSIPVSNDIYERYGLSNFETVILFANTITPRKGPEYLVKAANIIVKQFGYKHTLFLLTGRTTLDKEYVDRISKFIEKHNLGENVRLTGYIPFEDLKKLYVAADIFVSSSLEEGFGLSVMEAMASGKPLIGTNVGGIPMQIRDGWNGFLVEPANEVQLAEKIKYLLEHPEERKRMGKNSRKLAEEEFESSKIAERYLKVYEEI